MIAILKKPSAWLPLAMSAAAILMIVGYVIVVGAPEPQADEGTLAHIFQLLLVAQLPIMAVFLAKWLPREPKPAMYIFAFQILLVVLAVAAVLVLENAL